MNRMDIRYGGQHYSIGDRPLSDVMAEVGEIVASGKSGWLRVTNGSGSLREAFLLVSPGVPFALVPVELTDAELFEKAQADPHFSDPLRIDIDPLL